MRENPHAGFGEAGAGNVTMGVGLRAVCESRGITTKPYRRRASPRPYLRGPWGEIPQGYSPGTKRLVDDALRQAAIAPTGVIRRPHHFTAKSPISDIARTPVEAYVYEGSMT